ncbi:MAG TPA: hypothetical protein VK629_00790, partial [Steroidobacteraceae bacterium]|nr:hypothetical protein [Steroidobacteraceae bacterium]
AAQLVARDGQRLLLLDEIESLLASKALVVDACRFIVRDERSTVSLARRPILLALLRSLAEAWPQDAWRGTLIARVFRIKRADESHRVRLRVEIGRLRTAIKAIASITATKEGFILVPRRAPRIVVLAPPFEDANASVLALLADGESWSSSAIALALAASQRNVQRALDALASEGKIQSLGLGRARRWIAAPLPGFATTLLLPALLSNV